MVRAGVIQAIGILLILSVGLLAVGGAVGQEMDTLTVTVTDQEGNPISDVEVTAEWDEGSGSDVTRSNGNALIDVPSDERVKVSVEHDDYVQNVPKSVPASDDSVTIEMAEPGAAELTVVDQEDDDPVEGVQLRIEHTETGDHDDGALVDVIETGPDGVAEIAGIEQRSYSVDTHRSGYLDSETEFDIDGTEVTETIAIESSRVDIEFLVTDDHFETPQPLQGATIQVDGSPAGTTGSDGTQVTRLDVNDNYEIQIDKDGYDGITETYRVGETAETIEFSIQRSPQIVIEPLQTAVVVGQPTQVTIHDAYRDPVAGATVSVNGDGVGQTDQQGAIRFNVTETGENTIEASADGLEDSLTIEGVEPATEEPDAPDEGDEEDDDSESDEEETEEETEDGDDDESDSFGPGFGVLVALVAIVGFAFVASRRQ